MAILKSLIVRGGRKQIGGMVLYNRNGETVARELAPQVSNPRTEAQMQQRVKLANLVAFYRANKTWMRGAFENKKQRESDYNAFVSENIGNTLVATSKQEVDSGAAVVAPYKVTSGSLPIIEVTLNGSDLTTNIYVGNLSISPATTIAQLSQAILENNAGIIEGMQLSVIVNLQLASAGSNIPYIVVRAYEIIINQADNTLLSDVIPDGLLEAYGSTTKVLALVTSTLGEGAGTFVLSHTVGAGTKVSTQSLVFFSSNPTYRAYTSDAAWARAIRSYGEGTTSFLNSNAGSTSQSVATTLALLGVKYGDTALTPNGLTMTPSTSLSGTLTFSFNRSIGDSVATAKIQIVGTETSYDLTDITKSADGKQVTGTIPSGINDLNRIDTELVVVVDGDEYPFAQSFKADENE